MKPELNSLNGNGLIKPHDSNLQDIKKVISRMLGNWYWFIIAITIAVLAAYTYIRYTPPLYEIRATMLMGEGKSNSPITAIYGPGQGLIQDKRDLATLYNQIAIVTSSPIVSRTLAGLDFEVSYYSLGRVSETELYHNLPFHIIWDRNHPQIIENDFYLTIHPDKKMSVHSEGQNVKVHDYRTGTTLNTIPNFILKEEISDRTNLQSEDLKFIIVLNNEVPFSPGTFRFRFHSIQSLVNQYKSRLQVGIADNYASILSFAVQHYNIRKGTDFLNKLTQVYLDNNLEKKNQYAELTIEFIDSQLQSISDSLNISEGRLESFRRSNQVIDFSAQSQQLLTQLNQLDNEIIRHENQNKYYNYLREYIESNKNLESVIAPSSVGIDDPLLNGFIIQLNNLINEKSSQTSIRPNSDHPTFIQLNTQIEIVKSSLRQSINNIIRQSDIELENLKQRLLEYNAQIRRLPATERNFINFERKYRIDSQTYTFLLQKLSEARIAKASSIPDGQILESPYLQATVKPQRQRIYVIAVLLGLIFPASVILIRDMLNDKIVSKEDIAGITGYPVIGYVLREKKKQQTYTPVLDMPNSPAGNAYVSVRTKLHLLTKGKAHPVIAVTSSIPNEGKTFTAINIASSIALTHKKVVLLDLDVRNSQMAEIFDYPNAKGVIDYIIGLAEIDEIIQDTRHTWLKVIPAGPIPPNPAEMLSDNKLVELIQTLRKNFDAVIVDTPPMGIISDIFQLNDLIDANLIVVRQKFTPKNFLQMTFEEAGKHQMKGIGIIINGIRQKDGKNGYGYGYQYGYGDGYIYGRNATKGNRKILNPQEMKTENIST